MTVAPATHGCWWIGQDASVHIVAAPDKFRGTATARDVASAIARAAHAAGHTCDEAPMADGGEGTLEALGGANRSSVVTGPLGEPVDAPWRLLRGTAVIEMANASGLLLAGGPDENDPMGATTRGTGELIADAVEHGAKRVIVGVGGSATTDGGLGALDALFPPQRLRAIELVVACDVRTTFVDCAARFAPQKGASPAQVKLLQRRLEQLAQRYLEDYGRDIRELEGSGAAGGLAGGLAAIGATLESGFEVVSDEVQLAERLETADLVVTGEGFLDRESFEGKVVGGVFDLAGELDVPALAVVGRVYDDVPAGLDVVALVDEFGEERALADTAACVEEAVTTWLARAR